MVFLMQTNDLSAGPDIDTDAPPPGSVDLELDVVASGRSRRRRPREGQTERVSPRFTPADRAEVDAAAASAGMSISRFCAEAALAAARGSSALLASAHDREVLARLLRQLLAARTEVNRFAVNVNQAVVRLHTAGEMPPELLRAVELTRRSVQRLDEVIVVVDRRLR
jgi:hypothetical protein